MLFKLQHALGLVPVLLKFAVCNEASAISLTCSTVDLDREGEKHQGKGCCCTIRYGASVTGTRTTSCRTQYCSGHCPGAVGFWRKDSTPWILTRSPRFARELMGSIWNLEGIVRIADVNPLGTQGNLHMTTRAPGQAGNFCILWSVDKYTAACK